MATVTISKNKIEKHGGVVVLSLKEYERLNRLAVPTYYLSGKAAEKLDRLVEEGLKDLEKGRCKTIKSLADLDSNAKSKRD